MCRGFGGGLIIWCIFCLQVDRYITGGLISVQEGECLQYLCFLECPSISDVWDLCFPDFIVLESKGSFFRDFANVQHFWGYGMAWHTLLVYTSITPSFMHDSRSRKGTGFVPKHRKKTCKGTDKAHWIKAQLGHVSNIAKAHFRHSLGMA